MGYLRLRQIALVARDLAVVETQISDVLGLEICYRDPGVGKYGLHNALFAMSGTFLEVVSPLRDGTAGGRYLERRKGDGGYMYIVDCDDLERRRDHFTGMGVRLVQDIKSGDEVSTSEALHLHPKDTGATLLSVDRHSGGADMMGGYHWAGPRWQQKDRSKTVKAITGARMQCDDPAATAQRWSELLERPVTRHGDTWTIELDNARARFGPLEDDRGEGLASVRLACRDAKAILANAETHGANVGEAHGEPFVGLCGVRFVLA
jgi:Glyoxalase-like domain